MSARGSVQSVRRGPLEVFLEKHGMTLWKILVAFFVLYILMPPLLLVAISFEPSGFVRPLTGFTFHWYDVMLRTRGLMDALSKSIILAVLTMVITTFLALNAALGYRKTRFKTIVIAIMILPIFLPGLIQGFSLSIVLGQFLGMQRSIWTELAGHVLWALPFAFLVILTSMSVVRRETVLAAMDLGANEWRAFKDIEFSLDYPTEAEQDNQRGPGNWRLLHEQAERCRRLGVPVTFIAVMMRSNFDRLADIAEVVKDYDAPLRINVYQSVRTDTFALTYDEYWQGFESLFARTDVIAIGEPLVRAMAGMPLRRGVRRLTRMRARMPAGSAKSAEAAPWTPNQLATPTLAPVPRAWVSIAAQAAVFASPAAALSQAALRLTNFLIAASLAFERGGQVS